MLQGFKTYQLAVQLYRACERVTAAPHLRDQLSRASLSVVLNIAEGSAKPTAKDRRRFYATALGSAREVQALLELLGRGDLESLADALTACLYRLVNPRTANGIGQESRNLRSGPESGQSPSLTQTVTDPDSH